jgi:hypothetical protein
MSTDPSSGPHGGLERWVVDRFEGDRAVIVSEDGRSVDVERDALPRTCRAGDVVRVARGADGTFEWSDAAVDEEATRERRAEAERILDELKGRDPGGDVVL